MYEGKASHYAVEWPRMDLLFLASVFAAMCMISTFATLYHRKIRQVYDEAFAEWRRRGIVTHIEFVPATGGGALPGWWASCVSPLVFPNHHGRWHHRVKRCHNAKFAVNVYCPSGACCAGGDDGPIDVYRPGAARRLCRSSDAAPSAERRDGAGPNSVWLCSGLDVRGRDALTSTTPPRHRRAAYEARKKTRCDNVMSAY